MTPTTLSYQGTPVRLRGVMLNLTDMWQAAGRPLNWAPADWLALEATQRLRIHVDTHWTETDAPIATDAGPTGIWHLDTDGLVATVRGTQGGTWAHWRPARSRPAPMSQGRSPLPPASTGWVPTRRGVLRIWFAAPTEHDAGELVVEGWCRTQRLQ